MGHRIWVDSVLAGFGIALAFACSATSGDKPSGGVGGGSSGGGSGGTPGSGGIGVGGQLTGGTGAGSFDSGVADADDPDAACESLTEKANKPAVDIIWIIDNSCSMADEIEKVRTNINQSFVPTIDASIIDWQVLMVSQRGTNNYGVCVDPPLAGTNCADKPPRFHQLDCTVNSNDPFTITTNAYASPGIACKAGTQPWNKLARFDATKVFVVVTDDEAGAPFNLFMNGDQFDNWATMTAQPAGMFGTKTARKYVLHGIIGMDPNNPSAACTSSTNQAVAPGLEYQKLATLTGGIVRSICEDDWSNIFTTIAAGIVNTLSCEYVPPPPPNGKDLDPSKVNVYFTPDGGQQQDILQDNNAGCDQGANGWQWNADKSKILLCGTACDQVKADDQGQVDIEFGCATKTAPPPR